MPQSLAFRDVTRNQSTMDVTQRKVFLGNNYYQEADINNPAGSTITLKSGMIVQRDTTNAARVIPYVADNADLDGIVGILIMDDDTELAATTALSNINFAISGNVDETKLITSDGTAADLDTFVPTTTRTVRDALHKLGFKTIFTTENTKLDN